MKPIRETISVGAMIEMRRLRRQKEIEAVERAAALIATTPDEWTLLDADGEGAVLVAKGQRGRDLLVEFHRRAKTTK